MILFNRLASSKFLLILQNKFLCIFRGIFNQEWKVCLLSKSNNAIPKDVI